MINKVLLFLLVTFTFISCKNTGERYANLKPLTLGILSTDDYSLPPTLQHDSIGLEVNIIRFRTAIERDSALLSGTIDGTVLDYIDAILLKQNGLPLEIVMKNDTSYQLIAGIGNGIRSLELLYGRNIAVEKNTIIEYITDRILESVNISTETGVNKADIKKASLRLNLLQNGLVDASVLPGKYADIAIENGNYPLFSLQESDIAVIVTAFSQKTLNTKKKEVEVFVKEHNASAPSTEDISRITNWLKHKKIIQ